MADELLADPDYAHAVHSDPDGLMCVDYAAVGFIPPNFEAMRIEGRTALMQYRQQMTPL